MTRPEHRSGGGGTIGSARWRRVGGEIGALDEAIRVAITGTKTPTLDRPVARISNAANNGRLWFAVAALLGVVGGSRGRRAALRALLALAITSAVTNQVVKHAASRQRPEKPNVDSGRHVAMPLSSSFPSGHTASAFAFAATVSADFPLLALPLFGVASVVGYSRVHTGVHYPSDVIAGSVLGLALGAVVREATVKMTSKST